jgi:hypothetical protein
VFESPLDKFISMVSQNFQDSTMTFKLYFPDTPYSSLNGAPTCEAKNVYFTFSVSTTGVCSKITIADGFSKNSDYGYAKLSDIGNYNAPAGGLYNILRYKAIGCAVGVSGASHAFILVLPLCRDALPSFILVVRFLFLFLCRHKRINIQRSLLAATALHSQATAR